MLFAGSASRYNLHKSNSTTKLAPNIDRKKSFNVRKNSEIYPWPQNVNDDEYFKYTETRKKSILTFNSSQYNKDDVEITFKDNFLNIKLSKPVKENDKISIKDINRCYKIPQNIDINTLKKEFARNGDLIIKMKKSI
uniref:SHSP domain-containing protein n=1 Tax=Strongyloides papillosus TaxID=174720 RepID=A0A0N5BWN7_STREA